MHSRTLRSVLVAMVAGLALASPASAARYDFGIRIPSIGVSAPLSYYSLNHGPMVYYQDFNTLAVAGHRTTYTRPFWNINKIHRGNAIIVNHGRRNNFYKVMQTRIMRPWDLKKIRWWPGLILSACHPRGSAAWRYVVLAKYVG